MDKLELFAVRALLLRSVWGYNVIHSDNLQSDFSSGIR